FPIFIDLGSFEPYRKGEPWIGYRQFTRQFLFPLMLRSWVGIPFQPWLRGDMEGPSSIEMKTLLPAWRKFQPAALLHVVLQARMERRLSGRAMRDQLKKAGFTSDMIVANIRGLRRLVESFQWKPSTDGWSSYQSCGHVAGDRIEKSRFLTAALERVRPEQVVDLGANDGHFSKICMDNGAHAIAVDGDEAVLDDLYRQSSGRALSVVLSDLTDPSPSQGWAGVERPGLFQRIRPDLVVAFGLIHHLIYTSSIPPRSVMDWLYRFGCPVLVEFVSPADEMVNRLVGNKLPEELHQGTDEESFRNMMARRFEVTSEHILGSGTRIIFELHPRRSSSNRPPS
ncbi:MAG: methyltransferase, partial [Acidimicrobiia bacterium]